MQRGIFYDNNNVGVLSGSDTQFLSLNRQTENVGYNTFNDRFTTPKYQKQQLIMADSPPSVKKVHDIYPDSGDDSGCSTGSPTRARKPSVNGAINYARHRPTHIPRVVSRSYPAFREKQELALRLAIREIFDKEMQKSGIDHIENAGDKLTMHKCNSQSKLSQQELQDLQKSTHFDKKELQQWYKGMYLIITLH